MGLIGPIRGRGSLPHWPWRHGGPHPPYWCATPLLGGISPTSGREGGCHPSSAYIRRGRRALLFISINSLFLPPFSFLEWTPLIWRLVGDFSTIRTPSCCWNRDPNPSSFRGSSGSEPEGRRVYCMCIISRGTTLVGLLRRCGRIVRSSSTTFLRGRNPVIGYKDRVASGVIVDLCGIGDCRYDYINHILAGTFPASRTT